MVWFTRVWFSRAVSLSLTKLIVTVNALPDDNLLNLAVTLQCLS